MRFLFRLLVPASLLILLPGCSLTAPPQCPALPVPRHREVSRELESLREKQEALAAQLQRLQDNLLLAEGRLQDHEQRLQDFRTMLLAQKVTPGGEKTGWSATSEASAATGKVAAPTEIYLQAFADYASGRYPQAIAGFDNFLRLYAGSDYAGHAMYWLGECYFAQQQYPTAAAMFQKAVEQYPHSGKAPDALLKLAETLRKLDRQEAGGGRAEAVAAGLSGQPCRPQSQKFAIKVCVQCDGRRQ